MLFEQGMKLTCYSNVTTAGIAGKEGTAELDRICWFVGLL